MLCWQKPGMAIDAYTREFKACIKVCKAVGSGIGVSVPSTKLAYKAAGNNYERLRDSVNGAEIATFRKMQKSGRSLYLAALHFEGLNRMRYGALQKRVHGAFLISSGTNTMPTSINKTILMASQHNMEQGLDPSDPIKTQTKVVCIQHGMLGEHAGENEELKVIVMAQGEEEKKVVNTSSGERVVCFNPKCKGKDDNHFLHHCPRADAKERNAIMKTMQAKWAEEKRVKKTVAGQAHMQLSEQDIKQQACH